jgi:acetoacetyl-CoA synthetase
MTAKPSEALLRSCVLTRYAAFLEQTFAPALAPYDYDALHIWTVENPAQFWASLLLFCNLEMSNAFRASQQCRIPENLVFRRPCPPSGKPQLVDVEWFPEVRLSIAENILAYARSTPNKVALVSYPESPSDDHTHRTERTFRELHEDVACLADFLRKHGVQAGHTVAAVLPNDEAAIVAFLATNSLGAVFASCSPDLGSIAVTDRLAQLAPVAIFIMESTGYWYKCKWQNTQERTEKFMAQLMGTIKLVIACPGCNGPIPPKQESCPYKFPFVRLTDIRANASAAAKLEFRRMSFQEPVCILFTSGTTGTPKAIAHGNGIFLNHLKEQRLHLNQVQSSVVFQYTSLSWMMFNHMVSSLATGCRLVLYEGAPMPPSDPLRLFHISIRERVSHLGISPGLITQLAKMESHIFRGMGPDAFANLSVLMVTGAPSTLQNFNFIAENLGTHVAYISMSGGTDICGCFILGCPGWINVIPPRITRAGLGMNVKCLDEHGRHHVGDESEGELCCLSITPVYPLRFFGDPNHSKYKASYFSQFGESIWCHGDSVVEFDRSVGGGFVIVGRSDLVMNVHGVRLGSADIYRVTEHLPWIRDACAVGQRWAGDVRIVLVVELVDSEVLNAARLRELETIIRSSLSPRHVPSVVISARVPYTFSGKKSEAAVKQVLERRNVDSMSALRNPESLDEIRIAMIKHDSV